MHVGKQMAKLNPKNARFDIGSGGVPELTSTDIAAALAFVDAGLGREMLCRVWWPDGAVLVKQQLSDILERLQMDEWTKRESAMIDGLLAVAMRGSRGQGIYATAHENRWPEWVAIKQGLPRVLDGYGKVRDGVLIEMCSDGLCQVCMGRCFVGGEMVKITKCELCDGTGHEKISERDRAEACGMKWTTFRETWAGVYAWTASQCVDAIQQATRQFHAALGSV